MRTVLVVEDDLLVQDVTRDELEAAGYQVIVAADADEAIAVLEARQDIHLVFTDVRMPGSMDGAKLAAAVRHRWPPVNIIVTSGTGRPLTLPANALFIPKPYLSVAVVASIRSFEGM
jgi:CheY-like chemotaxis protein